MLALCVPYACPMLTLCLPYAYPMLTQVEAARRGEYDYTGRE